MSILNTETGLFNLKRKVDQYKEVLQHTEEYRTAWKEGLKEDISAHLKKLNEATELGAKVEEKSQMENLEAVILTLGDVQSGMYQQVNDDYQRHLMKHKGSLVYQQLFNGKVIVLINYPYIENYGQPKPPKTIGIYRPEELKEPFYVRHLEEFIKEITNWEDFDDDEPGQRIGFNFHLNQPPKEEDAK